ncbi:hypothetical protein CISIN_1g034790mg [Citrus sinensis]|uniref:Uncharacterized protein n=1 Tax=Citrus sinensis TaxID=2711 RepID=A0A067DB66_CITSI|nr:hypothetical protein CISIN_1g034790mg [Citrus sinensis]
MTTCSSASSLNLFSTFTFLIIISSSPHIVYHLFIVSYGLSPFHIYGFNIYPSALCKGVGSLSACSYNILISYVCISFNILNLY